MAKPKSIFQSHTCEGYRAQVTIEWSVPARIDGDTPPQERMGKAEDIACDLMAKLGPQTYNMVQAMRGLSEIAITGQKLVNRYNIAIAMA